MAHVERRERRTSDGTLLKTYRVRWRGPDGKERNKTFQKKVEADRFCAIVSADLVKGQYVDPDAGKIPFETLKTLSASATVSISADRHVTGFSITRPSGNNTFDDEVRATLQSIQSSGVEVPAPPPLYPDMLGHSLPVSFRCTNQGQCS